MKTYAVDIFDGGMRAFYVSDRSITSTAESRYREISEQEFLGAISRPLTLIDPKLRKRDKFYRYTTDEYGRDISATDPNGRRMSDYPE